jgi:hypothetical protein
MNDAASAIARERCGAKNRAGEPCKRWPAKGRSRCRLHGGATPIKHGLYSKDTPKTLGERIREMRDDPELLSLDRQAAIAQALQQSAIARFEEIERAIDEGAYRKALDAPDVLDVLRKLTETSAKIIARRQGVTDGKTVPLEVVSLLIDRVIHAVNRYVVDAAVRRSIALEVTRGLDLGEVVERT